MNIRRSRHALMVVLAACALVAVGCGGGSDSDDASDAVEQTSRSTAGSGSGGGSGDSSAFFANADCRKLARAFDQGQLSSAFTGGTDPTADLEAAAEFLDEAADEAPEAIRSDVQVLAETYSDLAEQSADIDWAGIRSGDVGALAGAAQLGQVFANSEFATAARNLSQYVADQCTG